MKIIEKDKIELIWKDVAKLSEKQAQENMVKLGARQSDLLGFVTNSVEDFKQDTLELGVYIFYVIYRMFETTSKKKLKRISSNKITAAHKTNEQTLAKLGGDNTLFYEQSRATETAKQPHVIDYLLNTLQEKDEDPEPVILSDDEISALFPILKTTVDVLNNAGK